MSSTANQGNNGLSAQDIQSDSAERHLLGCILRDATALLDVLTIIKTDDFRHFAHQRVYHAMLALWEKNSPIDCVTVTEQMVAQGDFRELPPDTFLDMRDLVATGGNAVHYAHIVHDAKHARELLRVGLRIVAERQNPAGSVQESQENAEREVLALAERHMGLSVCTLSEALQEALDAINARSVTADAPGLSTGFIDLDEQTAGGLRNSELIIVAARPSIGKTSFALHLFHHFVVTGRRPHFASLEQSRIELAERLLSCETGINGQKIRRAHLLSTQEADKLNACRAHLTKTISYIDDAPAQSCLRIAATARRIKKMHGLDCLIIDYLQLIDPEDRRAPRHEQVGAISRRLKGLARELCVPVIALAQLNRNLEDRPDHRPRLSDLRESGSIEADADTVLLLHRPDKEPQLLEVIIAKQRNGPTGEFQLVYDRHCMRFETHLQHEV